jgi:hypothetical protein
MTIPTNISYSTNSCRLSVRCTCDNLDVIDITLNKKRGNYRWRKKSDGQVTTGPLATGGCVQQYLLDLVETGRIPMTKAKSMLYALQDKTLRAGGGSGCLGALSQSGHVDWVDGHPGRPCGPVIVNDPILDPYAP